MNKKRILIVGFGAMGCRHAQSFLDKKEDYDVHILEPSDKNIKQIRDKIAQSPKKLVNKQYFRLLSY